MVAEKFTVDLNKPLVYQVGHLTDDDYEAWIHKPIVSKESPRFFGNPVVEFLTKNPWWAIPAIWMPVVLWNLNRSIEMNISPHALVACIVSGIFIWTLMEYVLHRFLFHIELSGPWGNTIHYLLHGCHHKHPMDGLRLVFPPAATFILLFPIWGFFKSVFPTPYRNAIFGSVLLGYIMYDCTHYYLHHGKPLTGVSNFLKRYHMNHHFRIHDKGFGITSHFWDIIFGTLPPESNKKSS